MVAQLHVQEGRTAGTVSPGAEPAVPEAGRGRLGGWRTQHKSLVQAWPAGFIRKV